jgi:CheY-like chemotaxis protein
MRAEGWRHTRIVALTGWGQQADRARTRDAGFDHHLTKPVDLEALAAWLGTAT